MKTHFNSLPSFWLHHWFNSNLYITSFFGQAFYPKKIWIAIKFLGVYLYQLILLVLVLLITFYLKRDI